MTQHQTVRQTILGTCSWVVPDIRDWRDQLGGLVEMEQHELVTLDRHVTQEVRELDG